MSDQNATYDLPNEIVEELHCSLCNGFVSCGPVKMRPNGGTICGRCSHLCDEGSIRNTLFETAMSKFRFPCRYNRQGCQKRLLFGAVEHEGMCPYRTFSCPSFGSCSENVSVFDVYQHFKDHHEDLILKDGKFQLDLEQNSQSNLLMAIKDVVVTIQYRYDSVEKVFHLDVTYFASNNLLGVSYKMQIISGLDSERIINFKENACRRYEWHMINKENACKFVMSNYLPALDNPNFIYIKVKLTSRSDNRLVSNTEPVIEDKSLVSFEQKVLTAWDSLENIRCVSCKCIAIPPIYRDRRDPNYIHCNECQKTIRGTFVKEMEIPNFPCRWRGCTFVGNENNIKKHVEDCELRTYICSVLCDEGCFTLNNLMNHMLQHGTYCPDPEKIVVDLFCADSLTKVYFTLFEGTLVAFTCYIRDKYDWNVEIGNNKFTFDVYFEHNHCLFKSQTFRDAKNNFSCATYKNDYPKCFSSCRRISAVLKIKSVEKD